MWGSSRPPFYAPRRQRRSADNVNMSPAVLMLLASIYQRYEELPVKPPVTFAIVGILVAAHIYPQVIGVPIDAICLSSAAILDAISFGYFEDVARRVVLSQIVHADDIHLYYNVTSLLIKGVLLEQRIGSEEFAIFTIFSVVVSAMLYTVVGSILQFGSGCAVGFSSVLFAMKIILDYDKAGMTSVWGVRVAARHAAWLEMLVASYVNPRSSLLGHASGIAAGLIWLKLPKSEIKTAFFSQQHHRARPSSSTRPRYSYASGTTNTARPESSTTSHQKHHPSYDRNVRYRGKQHDFSSVVSQLTPTF